MKSKKTKEKGWKPLPTSLKVLFVLFTISLISSITSINLITTERFILLGIYTGGIISIIIKLLLGIVGEAILVIAIWNRYSWTWKYGIAYFSFLILNGLLGMIPISNQITSEIYYIFIVENLFIILIEILFIIIFYKKRNYFKNAIKNL